MPNDITTRQPTRTMIEPKDIVMERLLRDFEVRKSASGADFHVEPMFRDYRIPIDNTDIADTHPPKKSTRAVPLRHPAISVPALLVAAVAVGFGVGCVSCLIAMELTR